MKEKKDAAKQAQEAATEKPKRQRHGVQCSAKSKQTGERCKRFCAPGKKVCYYHGANAGVKKGTKNALKHGAYEVITRDTLLEGEDKIADGLDLQHPIELLKEQIRMLKVKEVRIAKRMKNALLAEKEAGKEDKDGNKKPSVVLLNISAVQTRNFSGDTSKSSTSTSETHEMHYLRLDAAHTTVMNELRKAMSNLAQLQADLGINEEPLPLYTCPPKEGAKE